PTSTYGANAGPVSATRTTWTLYEVGAVGMLPLARMAATAMTAATTRPTTAMTAAAAYWERRGAYGERGRFMAVKLGPRRSAAAAVKADLRPRYARYVREWRRR